MKGELEGKINIDKLKENNYTFLFKKNYKS